MKLGFLKTFTQMVCSIFVLSIMIGFAYQKERKAVFGEQSIEVPIIMYHSILKDGARHGKYVISPEVLANDLDYLKKEGYQAIVTRDLVEYVQKGIPLPEKPVMITFDDGYFNNYVYAYPLLKERGMVGVVSIIGSQTELFTENGQENAYWSHLKLEHLVEMEDVFEVMNHSWDLHEYGERHGCLRITGQESISVYENMLISDTQQTQRLLETAGIPKPICYTYPFGACSEESERILKNMGFLCTLSCEEKINKISRNPDDLYELGRFNRPAGISTQQFMKKALGE